MRQAPSRTYKAPSSKMPSWRGTDVTNKPTWRPPHWSNYETHLDEAAFRLSQWEAALDAPDFILDEAAELEEQLAAHIDGLVLGGQPVARQLLEPSLASEEPEHITVAALSLLKGAAPPVPQRCSVRLSRPNRPRSPPSSAHWDSPPFQHFFRAFPPCCRRMTHSRNCRRLCSIHSASTESPPSSSVCPGSRIPCHK